MTSWIDRRKVIVEKISNTLSLAKSANKEIDLILLADEICGELGCSRRTAMEYIRIAKLRLNKRNIFK